MGVPLLFLEKGAGAERRSKKMGALNTLHRHGLMQVPHLILSPWDQNPKYITDTIVYRSRYLNLFVAKLRKSGS